MRNLRQILIFALCAAALTTVACNRPAEEKRAERSVPAAPASPSPAPQANELRPEPKSVIVEKPPVPPPADRTSELDARERRLAQRQADLEARERRLRQREAPPQSAPPPAAPLPNVESPSVEAPSQEEPAVSAAPAVEPAIESTVPEPAPEPVRVPAGTVFAAEVQGTVSSETSAVGDTFRARIVDDVLADGEVAIPRGSEIVGEVTEAVPRRKVGGQARLTIKFTDLVLPTGATVPIDASFAEQGRSKTGRDAATVGGAAAGGAILGHLASGRGGSLVGALLGAAVGAVIASRHPGEEVTLPRGTVVHLSLNDALRVIPR